jgi:DNA-binding MarR family transcriptional regulator
MEEWQMILVPRPTSNSQQARNGSDIDSFDRPFRSPEALAELALWIFRMRQKRRSFFGANLLSDASWDILLNLRAHREADRQAPSLFVSECAATSTGLRHLRKLERCGLVERWTDPQDKRRRFARLSPEGRERMDAYLRFLRQHS